MCQATDKGVILYWNQQRFKKSVALDPRSNVPVFRSAAGSYEYRSAFQAEANASIANEQVFDLTPNGQFQREDLRDYIGDENLLHSKEDDKGDQDHSLSFIPASIDNVDQSQSCQATNVQNELMRWHYRTGHLPFAKLKQLAINGEIPKYLAKVVPPFCAACTYGAMHRIRRNASGRSKVFTANHPGECVSVDQLESSQVGFLAQNKGRLTRDRYKAATVFIDHYSRVRYIHLMKEISSKETIKAKHAFETWASIHGVTIKHYHCDNGRFADNDFVAACNQQRQAVTYCGVNGHHQNGIAERGIRDLQDQARKQLLFAKNCWPMAIDLSLWPYALRAATQYHNQLRTDTSGKSPIEKFANVQVGTNMHHMHTFGCPVYALNNALASGNSLPKWSPRARLGINIGPSPRHARSVTLVLNPSTGLVSPQYHVKFDEFFESVQDIKDETGLSEWKRKAGLIAYDMNGQNSIIDAAAHNDLEFSYSDGNNESKTPDNQVPQGTKFPILQEDCDANVISSIGVEDFENQRFSQLPSKIQKPRALQPTTLRPQKHQQTESPVTSTSSRGRRRKANVRLTGYVASTAENTSGSGTRLATDTHSIGLINPVQHSLLGRISNGHQDVQGLSDEREHGTSDGTVNRDEWAYPTTHRLQTPLIKRGADITSRNVFHTSMTLARPGGGGPRNLQVRSGQGHPTGSTSMPPLELRPKRSFETADTEIRGLIRAMGTSDVIDDLGANAPGRDNKVVNHRSSMRKSAIDSALSATSNPLKSIIDLSKLADELDIVFDDDTSHDEHLLLQEKMRNPVAFAANMLGDTMYYHQAMAQPDADKFPSAIV